MGFEQLDEKTYKLNEYQALRVGKKGDYRIVYPLKVNNKINWKNMFRIDKTVLILLIALLLIVYNNNINLEECREISEDPCQYCKGTQAVVVPFSLEVDNVTREEYPRDSS